MTTTVAIWPVNGREENEWDYVLSNLQPDEVCLMGPYQGTNNVLRDAVHVADASELPSDELVLVLPLSAVNFTPTVSLQDFVHPADAVYIFGPNNEHIIPEDLGGRIPDHIVYIPTDTNDEMFNYAAYIVTMWHRRYG